jgi:hypothetical protein
MTDEKPVAPSSSPSQLQNGARAMADEPVEEYQPKSDIKQRGQVQSRRAFVQLWCAGFIAFLLGQLGAGSKAPQGKTT